MNRKCKLCGYDKADILCSKCRALICENCYDDENDSCLQCSGLYEENPRLRPEHAIIGIYLIASIILTSSIILFPKLGTRIILFPFTFEGLNGVTAIMASIIFFVLFTLPSIIPFYLNYHYSRHYVWGDSLFSLNENNSKTNTVTETVDYMITSEVPQKLKDSIDIYDNDTELVIKSISDKRFIKVYPLPENHTVDSLQYEFEGDFLLLKVSLKRR
jgi:hypothetical protein